MYRKAFDKFSSNKISRYTKNDVDSILKNPDIIRNRKKVESFVNNAKKFLEIKDEFGTFDEYICGQFVSYKTAVNKYRNWNEIPSTSRESEEMSRDLKRREFTFVGPTICYAFMQSVRMFNDRIVTCFRQRTVRGLILCLP